MKRALTLILSLVMVFTCLVPAIGVMAEPVISNEVTITPPVPEDPTIIDPVDPSVSLALSLIPATVSSGGTVTCLLTASNSGGAGNKTAYLYLPAGFTPVNPEALVYDPATGIVTWSLVDIQPNEERSLFVDVQAPELAEAGSTHTFTVQLDDQYGYAVVTILDTTLKLTLTSNIQKAEPGEAVSYKLTVKNTGKEKASGLLVTNDVPTGMVIKESSLTDGGVLEGNTISWVIDLKPGKSKTLKFLGDIPEDALEGETFVNIATVANLSASASVTVVEPEAILSLSKKVNNRTPAPGTTIKYTITVKNTGGADAYDVEVVDELPEDLEVYRNTISHDGEYAARYDEITWMVDVPAYSTIHLTFKGYVPDWMDDGDVMVNRAFIDGVDHDSARLVVTEDAVPKTGEVDVVPAAWNPANGGAAVTSNAVSPAAPAASTGAATLEADIAPLPPVQEMFLETHAQNQDLVGWLKVADQVDEPILQADNNDFYMVRNFSKADDEAGALFLDERNHLIPSDQHLLIYGHNMKSGAMFGKLASYRDLNYLMAHPTFTFQSVYDAEPTTYVIVAALDASMDVGNKDYLKIRRPNFDDEADALAYIESLKGFSYFDIPVEWDETDSMMSLVTCSYLQDNGRFLIIGRALREGETVESVIESYSGTTTRA